MVQLSDVNGTTCDFAVLGPTGNVYDAEIWEVQTCSGPDYAKGNLCKQNSIGLDPASLVVYRAAYLEELGGSWHVAGSGMANDKA